MIYITPADAAKAVRKFLVQSGLDETHVTEVATEAIKVTVQHVRGKYVTFLTLDTVVLERFAADHQPLDIRTLQAVHEDLERLRKDWDAYPASDHRRGLDIALKNVGYKIRQARMDEADCA